MIIHPQIQGCVARNCHPMGCRAAVLQQIEQVRAAGPFNGPKRVLVLGASSGFGPVSYTHLDVYKRQMQGSIMRISTATTCCSTRRARCG